MVAAPNKCIVCKSEASKDIWNDLSILICSNCGLAWRASFDLPTDYYVRLNEARGELETKKLLTRERNSQDRFKTIQRYLPTAGICDGGCGEGSFLELLKDSGYKQCWGIEPSEYYRGLALEHGLDVVQGEIKSINTLSKEKYLSAVTLFHVIEHLDNPIESLVNIKENLPSRGVLVIETPDNEAPIQRATGRSNELVYPEHLFYWNERSLKGILEAQGFEVVKVAHRSFDWRYAPIKTSLMRLNLSTNVRKMSGTLADNDKSKTQRDGVTITSRNWLKLALRGLLAHLTHVLRRDDYLLVIARRL